MSRNLKVYEFKIKTFHEYNGETEHDPRSYAGNFFTREIWGAIKAVTCGFYEEGDIITFYDEDEDVTFLTITCLGDGKMQIDSNVIMTF